MSKKTNIVPLGIRVLVRPIEQEAKTASGLILPDSAKEKPQIGEVIAVGDDEEMMVKVGQKVLFPKYTGTEIKLEGVEHMIMEATDLLAIVK
ncbi:MAG: co-chaperone GroES [Anaerolineales bacterium]|uniref:Co-chaperonin GroES n=1 Tax=Candidatus Desulfolinea nitratireducens TaxID=2841698 RepID=A0A8J6TKB0_9CHLR|nr:co-chaperone GroES [Candidatus Desulfolinea nitratireducens]MBL6959610.1 co-chaperone GroES [Anaerolineales bacterium]